MTDYRYVVFTNAVEGREDEFNRWYDGSHLDDVLSLPGFMAATRYEEADPFPQTPARHRYMAIYDIQSDDIAATMGELFTAAESGRMYVSDTMQDPVTFLYRTRGPEKRKPEEG